MYFVHLRSSTVSSTPMWLYLSLIIVLTLIVQLVLDCHTRIKARIRKRLRLYVYLVAKLEEPTHLSDCCQMAHTIVTLNRYELNFTITICMHVQLLLIVNTSNILYVDVPCVNYYKTNYISYCFHHRLL